MGNPDKIPEGKKIKIKKSGIFFLRPYRPALYIHQNKTNNIKCISHTYIPCLFYIKILNYNIELNLGEGENNARMNNRVAKTKNVT